MVPLPPLPLRTLGDREGRRGRERGTNVRSSVTSEEKTTSLYIKDKYLVPTCPLQGGIQIIQARRSKLRISHVEGAKQNCLLLS